MSGPPVLGTPVAPEWEPPAGLTDPYVNRADSPRVVWCNNITGNGVPHKAQLAGRTLADYGNPDGSNCFPGHELLATKLACSVRTVERHLAWLLDNGWLRLVTRGAKKSGEANHYHLAIPAPVAATLEVRTKKGGPKVWLWSAESGPQWGERPKGAPGTVNPRARRAPSGQFLPDTPSGSTRQNAPFYPTELTGHQVGTYQGVNQEDALAEAHEQARVRESDRPRRIHIFYPVAVSEGERTRKLVAAAAAAMKKEGKPLGFGGRDKLGRRLADQTDIPVEARVQQLTDLLESALDGTKGTEWLFGESEREPGYENTAEGFDQLEDDLSNVRGGSATIFSMAGNYHPNAIAHTAKKRCADA